MSEIQTTIFSFGPFRLNPATGVLDDGEKRVDVTGAPLRLLLILLASPERFVSTEALCEQLWPSDVHVGFEDCLKSHMHELRMRLGDSARSARFIETKRGMGYRLLCEVRRSGPPIRLDRPRIAVLPWRIGVSSQATSNSLDPAAMIPQLTEEIAGELRNRLPDAVIVTPRSQPRPAAAGIAGVQVAIRGMLERTQEGWWVHFEAQDESGTSLVIQLDATHAHNDQGQRMLLPAVDPPLLMGVGRRVASWLAHRWMIPYRDYAEEPDVPSEMRESCQRGFYLWNLRSRWGLLAAVEEFQKIIRHEPGYALAHAGLAYCSSMLGMYGMIEPGQAFTTAHEAAARALALHPVNPGALVARASARTALHFEHNQSEREVRSALSINPDLVEGWLCLSRYQVAGGRWDEVDATMEQIRKLDPVSPVVHAISIFVALFRRRFDEAVRHGHLATSLAPQLPIAQAYYCMALSQHGQHGEAVVLAHTLVVPNPEFPPALPIAGWALARAGETEAARLVLHRLQQECRQTHHVPTFTAALALELGEKTEALRWLQEAFRQRCSWLMFLGVDPRFDKLRSAPAFQTLLDRLRIKQTLSQEARSRTARHSRTAENAFRP